MFLTQAIPVTLNGIAFDVQNITTRDVWVTGGGAAGTYATIRLSDLGKSIAVVDHEDGLGGHTATYPFTGNFIFFCNNPRYRCGSLA